MSKTHIIAILLMALLVLTACQATAASGDTTALEVRIAALEEKMNGAAGTASAGDVAALINRVTVLEAQAGGSGGMEMEPSEAGEEHDADPATMSQEPLFAVTMATYIMDTAGFHTMDETINGEGTIDPTFVGSVNRVSRVLSVTPWPAAFAEQATTLQATLAEFAAALGNDDVEAAKPLATRVHDEQHEFSEALGEWISSQTGIEGGEHDD